MSFSEQTSHKLYD